jgi:tetratricopeptide (TPR) repeat protein
MSRFCVATTLASAGCALILAVGQPARADELQDITRLYRQGQSDKALERIESYLATRQKYALGPDIAEARFIKGLVLAEQGKNAEAIQVFTRLTEDFPELPEPYNNLGVLYASQGQYEKSRLALEMAISTHASYATAHENLGDIYAKMASQAYDKALQLDRSNVTAQTKLALIRELVSLSGKTSRASARPESAKVAVASVAPALAQAKIEPPKPASLPAVTPAPAPRPENPKAAPEVRPAPAVALAQGNTDAQAAVLATLDGWAKAWSSKNVPGYLSYYGTDFKLPGGEQRAEWERSRKERIDRPKSIGVAIESPRVAPVDANRAA